MDVVGQHPVDAQHVGFREPGVRLFLHEVSDVAIVAVTLWASRSCCSRPDPETLASSCATRLRAWSLKISMMMMPRTARATLSYRGAVPHLKRQPRLG